jgi:ribosomal protein S18 acetylase RimI-like enzyme
MGLPLNVIANSKLDIRIERMEVRDVRLVIGLVRTSFDQCIAPDYTKQGCREFYKSLCMDGFEERHSLGFVVSLAKIGTRIVGMIEYNDAGFISMLFVDIEFQRRGIASILFDSMESSVVSKRMDVRSSPYAVPFYKSRGFKVLGKLSAERGIRYLSMAKIKGT